MRTMTAILLLGLTACGAMDETGLGGETGAVQETSAPLKTRTTKIHRVQGAAPPAAAPESGQAALKAASTAVSTGNGITYSGGPIMSGTINIYYIWYGGWSAQTTTTILTDLANNLSGSPLFGINTTYGDNAGHTVSGLVHYAGSTTDAGSQGKSLTNSGVAAIVSSAITSGRLPSDANGVYFVLPTADVSETTPEGAVLCWNFCGWHTNTKVAGADIKYAFIGNPDHCSSPRACEAQTDVSPNNNPAADGMASVLVHELEESATDPDNNAWGAGSEAENGDLCAWTFGATYRLPNGGKANVRLGARDYLIQQDWVNQSKGYCGRRIDNTDVGVLAGNSGSGTLCPNGQAVGVRMDDEDDSNDNSSSGWIGGSVIDSNSTWNFCKVSGDAFFPLSSGKQYALLKLGIRCPNGSEEFTRYFDNEDDDNNNHVSGAAELYPNFISGNMNLHYCLFRNGPTKMSAFPEIGLGTYGVLSSDVGMSVPTGQVHEDDEDDSNNDSMSCGSFCTDAQKVMGGSGATTFKLAEVKDCSGSPNGWAGCAGTGCWVCSELLTQFPNYLRNHPNCVSNGTCNGFHGTCNANCPQPASVDR